MKKKATRTYINPDAEDSAEQQFQSGSCRGQYDWNSQVLHLGKTDRLHALHSRGTRQTCENQVELKFNRQEYTYKFSKALDQTEGISEKELAL